MKLQEIISETVVDFYRKVEADVQNDTGESILPLDAEDVLTMVDVEIWHVIKDTKHKSDLVPRWVLEDVLSQVFDRLDFKALADKVNKELCKE